MYVRSRNTTRVMNFFPPRANFFPSRTWKYKAVSAWDNIFAFTLIVIGVVSAVGKTHTVILMLLPITYADKKDWSKQYSGEETDVGRHRLNLSSPLEAVSWSSLNKALAINECNWCNVLIFRPQAFQIRSDLLSHRFSVNPTFSHRSARTTPIEPFCFEGWNKFSVPMWRAWLPYWTLK